MAARYEVKQIITDLSACYPDWKPARLDVTIGAYEDALQGFPADLLKRAADRCRDVCLFFPKIAEIRKMINEIRVADVPNTQTQWREKVPISPEIQQYLNDFRAKMVSKGKWKTGRPHKDVEMYSLPVEHLEPVADLNEPEVKEIHFLDYTDK